MNLNLKNGSYCFNKQQYKENQKKYNLRYDEIQEKINTLKKKGYLLDHSEDVISKHGFMHTFLYYVKMETSEKGKAYIFNVNTINDYGKEVLINEVEL